MHFVLSGLSPLTTHAGLYRIEVVASQSDIQDDAGNELLAGDEQQWQYDLTQPQVLSIGPVTPDPRNTAVGEVVIVFSKAVTGFDGQALTLTLDADASGDLLTAAQVLTTDDGSTWRLQDLSAICGGPRWKTFARGCDRDGNEVTAISVVVETCCRTTAKGPGGAIERAHGRDGRTPFRQNGAVTWKPRQPFTKAGPRARIHGKITCPRHARDGCSYNILSTPRTPEVHARRIRQRVNNCPHQGPE